METIHGCRVPIKAITVNAFDLFGALYDECSGRSLQGVIWAFGGATEIFILLVYAISVQEDVVTGANFFATRIRL